VPTATVVIPTYNRPDHLAAALGALAAQAEPDVPFDVVIVDDGSSPPVALPAGPWPFDLRVVRLPENRGRAAARNAGLEHAHSPLVAFLDDDMRAQPGFVRAHVAAIDPAGRDVGLGRVTFHPDVPRDRLTRYLETRGAAKLDAAEPIPFRYLLTWNSAAPTALLRRVGGFDERLRAWGGEDLELGWRLAKAGARLVRVPDAWALHAHRRDVDAVWDVSVRFARESLPLILEMHPDLVRELRADLLGPARYGGRTWRRRAVRLATAAPLPDLARRLLARWPSFPWPMALYHYLIASAWRRGLDRASPAGSGGTI